MGPPPPSPYPNVYKHSSVTERFLLFQMAFSISSLLYSVSRSGGLGLQDSLVASGVVFFGGRLMRQYLRPIQCDPVERRVWEDRDVTPTKLRREAQTECSSMLTFWVKK